MLNTCGIRFFSSLKIVKGSLILIFVELFYSVKQSDSDLCCGIGWHRRGGWVTGLCSYKFHRSGISTGTERLPR